MNLNALNLNQSQSNKSNSRKSGCRIRSLFITALVCWPAVNLFSVPSVFAQAPSSELMDLSIDQLINLEVTSPAKKTERIADSASAIFVLSSEDIRRSGATSIPELLRLVPGLNVARIDNSQWAITSRGFNGVFGDKLLVLMDGRSIYTPLFAGVFWNEHDTMIEDIDRIEVIRGPGATLYGANAVNGVINIITKSAKDTKGGLVTGGAGKEERGFASARYGEKLGDTNYRAYAKVFDRDDQELATGQKADDMWRGVRSGFRTDTKVDTDLFTVQGDYYYGESGWNLIVPSLTQLSTSTKEVRYHQGGNVLGRWTREFSEKEQLTVQTYYDYIYRDDEVLGENRHTMDVDTEYHFSPLQGHDVVSGLGYRFYQDQMEDSFSVSVNPKSDELHLFTGFIQDEISLIPDTLRLIAGTKIEHNDLSGIEIQPNARMIYTPDDKNSLWAAVSRAVRSPARFNHDGRLLLKVFPGGSFPGDNGLPSVVSLNGQDGYDSIEVIAYETGYRAQLSQRLSFDVVGFYNDYDRIESAEPSGAPFLNVSSPVSPYIEVPYAVYNRVNGSTAGIEFATDYRPLDWWRLVGTYTYLHMNIRPGKDSVDTIYSSADGESPKNQFSLRSMMNLPWDLELDGTLRYVSRVPNFGVASYVETDLRLGWRATRSLELSVVGQNLVHSSHLEFASNLVDTERTQIQRGVFGKATYRF